MLIHLFRTKTFFFLTLKENTFQTQSVVVFTREINVQTDLILWKLSGVSLSCSCVAHNRTLSMSDMFSPTGNILFGLGKRWWGGRGGFICHGVWMYRQYQYQWKGRRQRISSKLCATTSTRLLANCFCISRDGSPSYLIQTSIAARWCVAPWLFSGADMRFTFVFLGEMSWRMSKLQDEVHEIWVKHSCFPQEPCNFTLTSHLSPSSGQNFSLSSNMFFF